MKVLNKRNLIFVILSIAILIACVLPVILNENAVISFNSLPAIIFGAPILLLIPFAGESLENAILVFGIVCALFVIYNIILLRRDIFKLGRRKKNVKVKNKD